MLISESIEVEKISQKDFNRRLIGADTRYIIERIRQIKMPDEVRRQLEKKVVELTRLFARDTFDVLNALGLNKPSQLAGRFSDVAVNWNLIDNNVVAFARERAGEMISGDIMETTLSRIQEAVTNALQEGQSIGELKESILDSGIFSEARAEMIARTETAIASIDGKQETMKEILPDGFKEWLLATDACEECEVYDGVVVPIGEDFPEGDPPLHPNCRCDLTYWTSEEIDQREQEPDTPILELGLET